MPNTPIAPGNTQRLTLDISHCAEETRTFELTGQQSLSAPYELSAHFSCTLPDLDLSQLVRQAAIINLYYKNAAVISMALLKTPPLKASTAMPMSIKLPWYPNCGL